MRRKSRPEVLNLRAYPYRAAFNVHTWRTGASRDDEQAAAAAIGGGDVRSLAPRSRDYSIEYCFKSAEQAHAMQIWFEAHAKPYDEWEYRVSCWEKERYGAAWMPRG